MKRNEIKFPPFFPLLGLCHYDDSSWNYSISRSFDDGQAIWRRIVIAVTHNWNLSLSFVSWMKPRLWSIDRKAPAWISLSSASKTHKMMTEKRRATSSSRTARKKRHTLTGYRSQLPHAEIFVTQLIARVWPFAVRVYVCLCVCVCQWWVFVFYIKTFPSISITIYILCVWLGRRTTKTKMITISTLRFDGEADDTTTWRYFFLQFCMLHVVKAMKNRRSREWRCTRHDKHWGKVNFPIHKQSKAIRRSDARSAAIKITDHLCFVLLSLPRAQCNRWVPPAILLLFFRMLFSPTFTYETHTRCAITGLLGNNMWRRSNNREKKFHSTKLRKKID